MNAISDIETFCQRLRGGPEALGERSVELYRQFLRGNIEEVLSHVFPLFCARLSAEQLRSRIDDFLAGHASSSPEFHHIATEFLCFSQAGLPADLRQCLEYEWLLFSVEIDEAVVTPPSAGQATESSVFSLNPTLACIELQLDFAGLAGPYAIFRDARHQVIRKPLSALDRWLLEALRTPCAYPALSAEVPPDTLWTWLKEALVTGLIQMRDMRAPASDTGRPI